MDNPEVTLAKLWAVILIVVIIACIVFVEGVVGEAILIIGGVVFVVVATALSAFVLAEHYLD